MNEIDEVIEYLTTNRSLLEKSVAAWLKVEPNGDSHRSFMELIVDMPSAEQLQKDIDLAEHVFECEQSTGQECYCA